LAADCRLDNRKELGDRLGISAATQAGMCDAQFILAALERWGEESLPYLNGDYAFAAWDRKARRLLIARDHLDGRPLHYHAGQGWFAFASMPKGLLTLPDVLTGPDPIRLAKWQMLLPLTGSNSFFQGVSRLEPGHFATLTADGHFKISKHWDPRNIPQRTPKNDQALADGLFDALNQAVKARLRGTSNTSLMLSGGLDSAAVAACAAPLLATQGRRLTAFTSVPGRSYSVPNCRNWLGDELALAEQTVAAHPNIDHHLIHAEDADFLAAIEQMILLADQPVMNPTNTAWLSEIYTQAREKNAGIVLTGTRGNMALTYTGEHLIEQYAREKRWLALWTAAQAITQAKGSGSSFQVIRPFLRPYLPPGLLNLWRLRPGAPKANRRDALPINFLSLPGLGLDPDAWKHNGETDHYVRWQEFATWVFSTMDGGALNAAANAGYAVDRRDPTGDKRVLEYCYSLGAEYFLCDGKTKALFRKAFSNHIPAATLNNKQRGLQASDWKQILLSAQPAITKELEYQTQITECTQLTDVDDLRKLAANLAQADPSDWSDFKRYHLKLTRGLSAGIFTRHASGGN
jgi:asparagine synthase (glutamine-hydrolysing)